MRSPAILKEDIDQKNIGDLYCDSMYMEVFRELVPSSSSSTSSLASSTTAAPAAAPSLELEHMFDKVVTPSDVGKLNRLVIPKQHAEKYFPLDPGSADKGVLLCFEECAAREGGGKQWQFRYSYWNSSQSYVMTKGWSRYVKDKQLDSGDTVSFSRSASGRLFIDCQRRRQLLLRRYPVQVARWGRYFPPSMRPPTYNSYAGAMWCSYFQAAQQARAPMGGGSAAEPPLVLESVPVLQHVAEPKRVRLFGVDLECAEAETSTSTPADLQLVLAPKPPFLSGGKEVEEEHGSRQWTK